MRASVFLVAAVLSGCGSKIETPPENPATDTGVASDTSASETAEDAPSVDSAEAGIKPTEERTCKRLIDAYCSPATQDCCNELTIPWAEAACREAARSYCTSLIDQVTLGRVTYDDTQLEACAKSWETPATTCRSEFIPYLQNAVACAHLFNGVREPGSDCTASFQCKAPPGGVAHCDQTAKRCRASSISPEGGACNFTGSNVRFCADGLYCDLTGSVAACKKELAEGAACSAANYIACGYSRTCVDGKCGAGLDVDSSCTENAQCASWTCRDGKCTSLFYNRVDKGLCNGGTSG